jgi:hypothetical protein
MPPRMENAVETAGFALFTIEHCVVLIWKQPPVLAGIEECKRIFQLVRTRRPKEKFSYLAVVESRAGTNMPAEVREALSALLREYQSAIAGSAIVFEGTGFRASIVRSVVAAINLASRLEFASTVESDLGTAARWLVDRAKGALTSGDLIEVVRAFRSRPSYAMQLTS